MDRVISQAGQLLYRIVPVGSGMGWLPCQESCKTAFKSRLGGSTAEEQKL